MMKWMGEDRDDELWRVGFFCVPGCYGRLS